MVKFRIWDSEKSCYRYPEQESSPTVCYGSRYIWFPVFFNASNPDIKYELECFTGNHDEEGNEIYIKVS